MLLLILCVTVLAQGGFTHPAAKDLKKSLDESMKDKIPYIIGGEIVQGREFPGLGSLNLMGTHYCSVCILNSEWVFTTAASMTFDIKSYRVVVGTNQLDNGGTVHELSQVIIHEEYNISDSWINNIALLKLNPPIQFVEGLSPVILPESGLAYPVGITGTMAGWGQIDFMGPVVNDLRKIKMTLSDHTKCEEAYAPIGKPVYPIQICAVSGVDMHGPLFGDGADPMFVEGIVIGIASWERNANKIGYPVVMTKISLYIDWFNENMNA